MLIISTEDSLAVSGKTPAACPADLRAARATVASDGACNRSPTFPSPSPTVTLPPTPSLSRSVVFVGKRLSDELIISAGCLINDHLITRTIILGQRGLREARRRVGLLSSIWPRDCINSAIGLCREYAKECRLSN